MSTRSPKRPSKKRARPPRVRPARRRVAAPVAPPTSIDVPAPFGIAGTAEMKLIPTATTISEGGSATQPSAPRPVQHTLQEIAVHLSHEVSALLSIVSRLGHVKHALVGGSSAVATWPDSLVRVQEQNESVKANLDRSVNELMTIRSAFDVVTSQLEQS